MMILQDTDRSTQCVQSGLHKPSTAHHLKFTNALNSVVDKVAALIPQFGSRNPGISKPDSLQYEFCSPGDWKASFWCGQLWLAHSITEEEQFKSSAIMRNTYFSNILENPESHYHDLGFLFSLSSVAHYKQTGDLTAYETSIQAAELLTTRWRQSLKFVRCWNPITRHEPEPATRQSCTLNIDSAQSMALLLWAAKETGRSFFSDIAQIHLDTCRTQLLRADFSTYHCREFDKQTGLPLNFDQHTAVQCCWSLAQSRALHGFAQSYLTTRDLLYRDTAAKIADYIADNLPEDGIPYWGYNLPEGCKLVRDTSAAAAAAAGLYALALGFGPGLESDKYTALADRILTALVERHDITDIPDSQGLLDQGTDFLDAGRANCMLPYGDYFYMEALMRSVGHTEFFW